MATLLYANNAVSRLRAATDAVSTSIQLPTGDGVKFPVPGVDEFFKLTLEDRRNGTMEICHCTGNALDILTVVRGQEGTVGTDFLVGAVAANRVTAGTLQYFQDAIEEAGGYSTVEADARFANVAGDTMTGQLNGITPVAAGNLTRKDYVDTQVATRAPTVHTHTIAQVTDLQTSLDAKVDDAPTDGAMYGQISGNWAVIDWTNVAGKPATFPPTLPITTAGVTGLDAALALKLEDAPSDGEQYSRKDGAWEQFTIPAPAPAVGLVDVSDSAPVSPIDKQLWWKSSTGALLIRYNDGDTIQWVQVNSQPGSVGEAPLDGQNYARKDGGWAVTAGGGGGAITEAPTDGLNYLRKGSTAGWTAGLPLTGGTITGQLAVNNYSSFTYSVVGYTMQVNNPLGNAAAGGLIAYSASIYGILGYGNQYSLYGNGALYVGVGQFSSTLTVNGILWATGSAGSTTANGANCYINPAGNIHRSTSSMRFKKDIEPLEDPHADKVLELAPIFYRPGENTVDRQDWSRYGFGAEDVFAIDPRFVVSEKVPLLNEDGTPQFEEFEDELIDPADPKKRIVNKRKGRMRMSETEVPVHLDLNAIIAALLSVVKRQEARIAALEAR